MTADDIKTVLIRYFTKKRMAVNVELGLCKKGKYRADLIALSMNGYLTIVEVKSSVADFRSDKKHHNYLKYCHRFYFAVSSSVYKKLKDEFPKEAGVFVISEKKDTLGRVLKKAKVKKRAKNQELDDDTRFNLIVRMAFRGADFNRYKKARKNQC